MKTIINVTQDDIDNGERKLCSKCPVARAMIRTLARPVSVTSNHIYDETKRDYNGATVLYALPESTKAFVYAFDANVAVQPFSFELDIID